jgi:hypothetical protein
MGIEQAKTSHHLKNSFSGVSNDVNRRKSGSNRRRLAQLVVALSWVLKASDED